jgi:hypothetical protein
MQSLGKVSCRCLAIVASWCLAIASANAALVVADFNDIAAGGINGKAGGTGLSSTWNGSAGGNVVTGNLTSSLYNITPSGTAQHYQSVNATGLRQNFRTITTSPAGEVWFSFLAMVDVAGNRAGVSLNAPTGTPFQDPGTVYAYMNGTSLNYSFGTGTAGSVVTTNALGSTALIVGRMNIVGSSGLDSISLWVNPDLVANSNIFAYTPVYSSSSVNFLDTLTTLGAIAARVDGGTTGAGNVDMIRFSDGGGNAAQAYIDVTGVPEPSTMALGAVGFIGLLLYRSRRLHRS